MIKLHDAQSFGDSSTRSEGAGVFTRPGPRADLAYYENASQKRREEKRREEKRREEKRREEKRREEKRRGDCKSGKQIKTPSCQEADLCWWASRLSLPRVHGVLRAAGCLAHECALIVVKDVKAN